VQEAGPFSDDCLKFCCDAADVASVQDRHLIWLYGDRTRMLIVSVVVAGVVGIFLALEGNSAKMSIGLAAGLLLFQAATGEIVGREVRRNLAKRRGGTPSGSETGPG
jgi:hypothetical protein